MVFSDIKVARACGPISSGQVIHIKDTGATLRVLPTMTVKAFGMKLRKVMKYSSQIGPAALWLLSASNTGEANALRCFDPDPLRDLAWSGVEDGSLIGLVCD